MLRSLEEQDLKEDLKWSVKALMTDVHVSSQGTTRLVPSSAAA